MRILIVSGESLPGSEDRNLPLAAELIRRGHSVRHTGPDKAMAGAGFSSTTYEPEFAQTPEAVACRTELFETWGQLRRMISWAQVVVFSVAKGYKDVAAYAADLSKIVIWLVDCLLHLWVWYADLVAVSSPYERDRLIAITGKHRIPKPKGRVKRLGWLPEIYVDIEPDRFHVTGSTILDRAAPRNRRLSKKAFFTKYGLDMDKKTAVWLPSSPAVHSQWFKGLYQRVCRIVKDEAGFNLIIKPHPRDYAGNKQESTYENTQIPTWQQLAPNVVVCDPEDKWDCFRAADVVIAPYTTAVIEAALVATPALLVDILPFALEIVGFIDPGLKKFLPRRRYSPPSRRSLITKEYILDALRGKIDPEIEKSIEESIQDEQYYFQVGAFEYIGTDCTVEELPEILEKCLYRFESKDVFSAYAERYSGGLDGRSYFRIADLVESVETDPEFIQKLAKERSRLNRARVYFSYFYQNIKGKIANRLNLPYVETYAKALPFRD